MKMKKILFTGGTGFLGRNLVPLLTKEYALIAPNRQELNLTDITSLENYIKENNFDVIIHAAIPNIAFNKNDKQETLLKDSLLTFLTFYQLQQYYGKLIYFGSGAEFDKNFAIHQVSENDFGIHLPTSDYGLAKYTMNTLCRNSTNIYNLRIFGCYGPTDANFKLITYAIRCCLKNEPIKLHQDCMFDYMSVFDLYTPLTYCIENSPKYHDYNICSGISTSLTTICELIKKELNSTVPVYVEKPGFNNEYSGQNTRICSEIPEIKFTPLIEGIRYQIIYEKEVYENEKKSC